MILVAVPRPRVRVCITLLSPPGRGMAYIRSAVYDARLRRCQVELYGGLLLFCGFILYDTQLIIERRRRGDRDYVWHSLMLFVDFVDVFRHILVILMQKEVRCGICFLDSMLQCL